MKVFFDHIVHKLKKKNVKFKLKPSQAARGVFRILILNVGAER